MDLSEPISAGPIWTSLELWAVVAATGVFTVLLTWTSDGVRALYTQRRQAKFSAVRCAVALESYAVECWKIVLNSNGHYELTKTALPFTFPSAPALPDDIHWEALGAELSDDILSFMNRTTIAEAEAEYAAIYESNPFDAMPAVAGRGLYALDLARRIRAAFRLPPKIEVRQHLDELTKFAETQSAVRAS